MLLEHVGCCSVSPTHAKKKKEKENTEQCGMENQSSDMMQDKLLEQKILFFGSAGVQSKKSFLKSVHNIKWN